jgi:hypothetical protein
MPWMAAAAVAAPIIAGVIANMQSKKDRASQKDAMKKALAQFDEAGTPPDLSKALLLKEFERAGMYTPELEQDLNDTVAESEVGKIQEDSSLRDAQKSALVSMQKRGKVGLSAEDRAALNQVRSEVQRDSEAKRQQILQSMQSKGMGGSGASLAAQLQSAQGAADQAASGSDALMAQAQQRALQALGQSADMAGNIRGQDFGVAQAKGTAIDERNRFLAQNSIERQRANVGSLNEAQRMNLTEQQRIADANTQMQNAELLRQNQAKRDQFQDKLNLAASKAGQYQRQADYSGQQAANTAQSYGQIGSAVGTGIAGYAQSQQNQAAADQGQANVDRQYELDRIKALKSK